MIKRSKKTIPFEKRYTFELLDPNSERAEQLANDPYFIEKDRRARERLKNCPIPEELIEKMLASKKNYFK